MNFASEGKRVTRKGSHVDIESRFGLFDQDGSLAGLGREIWALIEPDAEQVARAFARQYVQSYNPGQPIDPAREAELIAIFREATRLEADFWQMGWRAGKR